MNDRSAGKLLAWIDERSPWQFVAILYGARWAALAPIMALSHFVSTQSQTSAASIPKQWSEGSPCGLFLGLVVIPPPLETLVECALPYWVISRVRDCQTNRPNRCWGFVAVSARVLAVLHPMLAAATCRPSSPGLPLHTVLVQRIQMPHLGGTTCQPRHPKGL